MRRDVRPKKMMKWIRAIAATSVVLLLAGCMTRPQAGTYHGYKGKLGTHTLVVRSDGTISDHYGPLRLEGRWTAVTNMMIKAEVQGFEKHASTRFYALDKASGSFRWHYQLDELMAEQGPNHRPEGIGDPLRGSPSPQP